jgi:hypothetical protein
MSPAERATAMIRRKRMRSAGQGRLPAVGAFCLCVLLPHPMPTPRDHRTVVEPVTSRDARAARAIALNESGRLHLISKHGFTLDEQGVASGTASGTIDVRLTAVSTSRVTAELNIYPRGGSISGDGAGSYHRTGATAGFSGSMSIDRGTGSYAHVHGKGLSFSGTIQESNHDAITVHVSGTVIY